MSNPTIGFIGIGLMGAAMCNRLIDKGHSLVIVANRSRERVDALVSRGADEVSTAREVAAASDIIMICVDTSASVEQRMQGNDGILAGLSNGKVVIDFGTSLPGSTRALGELVAEKGATYLDSPIGRTPSHALEGKLNLMCSGERSAFDKVLPVLEDVGENVFHLGALGTGHTIKLYCHYSRTRNSCCFTILKLSETWLRKDFHSLGMISRKNLRIALANCFCVG